MKKVISIMTIAFASIFAFAQTENKAVVQQTQTTAQTYKADANVTPAQVKNNTSLLISVMQTEIFK